VGTKAPSRRCDGFVSVTSVTSSDLRVVNKKFLSTAGGKTHDVKDSGEKDLGDCIFGLGDNEEDDSEEDVGDREARTAATEGGSCSACFTASISPLLRGGFGVAMRGGLGGGGPLGSMANAARGGGGRGPAVACKPR
jgi:hypothetical protein